jgi:hypothetical protein
MIPNPLAIVKGKEIIFKNEAFIALANRLKVEQELEGIEDKPSSFQIENDHLTIKHTKITW